MQGEFICMEETVSDTQKKIRQWSSTGYSIEIVSQQVIKDSSTNGVTVLVTSLWRKK